ncbi:MAG: chemotaxis protein CheB [Acidobacteriota bacterium]|nr:chemotaxis protein CheB [Acidobacteriota bacterium]
MAKQDIIVIGASAGGVAALQTLVAGFPADLPAAVFIVLHSGAGSKTQLPAILSRAGSLPVTLAMDSAPIEHGNIYVAKPDVHLILEQGHMHLQSGPRENFQRPAINPLFRSAAIAYGERVAGVLLTGLGDDGVPGLWEVKRRGGVTIIQDPEEAEFPEMPRNAADAVSIDYPISLSDMPALLTRLAREGCEPEEWSGDAEGGTHVTLLTCPECQGVLSTHPAGKLPEFACIIGHRYSARTLHDAITIADENALWAAVRALEQSAMFARQYARELWPDMEREAQRKAEQADVIRKLLKRAQVPAELSATETEAALMKS